MRTIKFRGFSQKENKWIYGYGAFGPGFMGEGYIINYEIYSKGMQVVNLNTIGQFTGIKDKHNNEIYEGDIVKFDDGEIVEVVFFCGAFMPKLNKYQGITIHDNSKPIWQDGEVIGNIYENGDLLK